MKEVQKIARRVILLMIDILVFTYQIVRKVILPTRGRKGNILSSLLSFFVGLLEKIVSFEKSILRQPVVFTHKYVKQALMLAVGFLVLLSSIEWTVGQSSTAAVDETQAVIIHEPAGDSVTIVAQRLVNYSIQIRAGSFLPGYLSHNFSQPLPDGPVTVKRWLWHCNFRI